jgi:hypothetical protein
VPYGVHLLCELHFERHLRRCASLPLSGRSRGCEHKSAEDGGYDDPHDSSFGRAGGFL